MSLNASSRTARETRTRILDRARIADRRSEVKHDLDAVSHLVQCACIAHVSLDEAHLLQPFKVLTITSNQIVEHDNVVPVFGQEPRYVGADKTRPAGYQCLAHFRL